MPCMHIMVCMPVGKPTVEGLKPSKAPQIALHICVQCTAGAGVLLLAPHDGKQ